MKYLTSCILVVYIGTTLVLSVCQPWVLGDGNSFLKNFVNHEFLNLLGVILAITLASAANVHFEFNKIEDVLMRPLAVETRHELRKTLMHLVSVFVTGVLIVIIKPLVPGDIATSLFNSAALLMVLINVIVLTDLTFLIFNIPPVYELLQEQRNGEPDESRVSETEGQSTPVHPKVEDASQ